jgi:hypothetical protein
MDGRDGCSAMAALCSEDHGSCHLRACGYLVELPGAFANHRAEAARHLLLRPVAPVPRPGPLDTGSDRHLRASTFALRMHRLE